MPDLAVGSGAGGGIGGIPTKYVVIGVGVLGLGAILLMQRSGGGGGGSGAVASPQLGPHATLALGSLESTERRQWGEMQELLKDWFGAQDDLINGGFDAIGGQLGGMSSYQHQMQQSLLGLYLPMLTQGQDTSDVAVRQSIWEWLTAKFDAYGLGPLAPFDPSQDIWGTPGVYPTRGSHQTGFTDTGGPGADDGSVIQQPALT